MRSAGSKRKRRRVNGNPAKIGVYGSSERRPCAELLAMRPRDSRYNAIPLREAPRADRFSRIRRDALAPISNTFARYQNAEKLKRSAMGRNHTDVLRPLGHDPRKQSAGDPRPARNNHKVPFLIMQGRSRRQRSSGGTGRDSRRPLENAGGDISSTSCSKVASTEWVAQPGPQTDHAREMVKAFIARQGERFVIAATLILAPLPSLVGVRPITVGAPAELRVVTCQVISLICRGYG